MTTDDAHRTGWRRFLPNPGTPAYHLMLACVAIFFLGPLGGISAAYMNFSLGFFVGGQVLAGILGSTVTFGYGPQGRHGANYMQTMAASVAGISGMAVLVQAMVWMGLPEPPAWKLVLFFTSIGMFGAGVGMLYTPVLVDRMRLPFPSGYAVANILRALTDPALLRRSIMKLGGGAFGGFLAGFGTLRIPQLESLGLSVATVGSGFIVGARIAVPALVVAIIGLLITPYMREIGWLAHGEPFRKIGFIIALGTILGAAIVDLSLLGYQFVQRLKDKSPDSAAPADDWKRVNTWKLILWIAFWGATLSVVAHSVLGQPLFFILTALGLVFVFVMVNGISQGISDSNPISSAFVVSIFIMVGLGLKDPAVGLMCGTILLISCGVGVDMQQDRSTGWRLGTNRVVQFRYQVAGVLMGAVLAVALSKVFMSAYPVLRVDQFATPLENSPWQSTMTYKFVGALRSITNPAPHVLHALWTGIGLGIAIELVRKFVKSRKAYRQFVRDHRKGRAADFVLDAIVIPSPYASSFGGFFDLPPMIWFAAGGIAGSFVDTMQETKRLREPRPVEGEIPADMSTTSLIGGGIIAGDSLACLSWGLYNLARTIF